MSGLAEEQVEAIAARHMPAHAHLRGMVAAAIREALATSASLEVVKRPPPAPPLSTAVADGMVCMRLGAARMVPRPPTRTSVPLEADYSSMPPDGLETQDLMPRSFAGPHTPAGDTEVDGA